MQIPSLTSLRVLLRMAKGFDDFGDPTSSPLIGHKCKNLVVALAIRRRPPRPCADRTDWAVNGLNRLAHGLGSLYVHCPCQGTYGMASLGAALTENRGPQ